MNFGQSIEYNKKNDLGRLAQQNLVFFLKKKALYEVKALQLFSRKIIFI